MNENPYQSPKEANSRPTVKAGVALGSLLLLLSIPAGCICGGVTCFSAGLAGDSMSNVAGGYYLGWLLGDSSRRRGCRADSSRRYLSLWKAGGQG
jgi:hypothetical protein